MVRKKRSRAPHSDSKRPKSRRQRDSASPQKNRPKKFNLENQKPLSLKATVQKTKRGSAFLIFDEHGYDDLFIPPRDAECYFDGDRVRARILPNGEVLNIEVTEHRFSELVGHFVSNPRSKKQSGTLIYEGKRNKEEVFIPSTQSFKPKNGDWIRCKIEFNDSNPIATLLEVYGEDLPASADIPLIAGEFRLIEKHSQKTVDEARSLKLEIPSDRLDLTELPLITIDGKDARDFDDAVFVEKKEKTFVLWVGIADVCHYVKPGTSLDDEARSRGTSVYFPERAFHMLPKELSEELCSLKPNVKRLSFVAEIHFDFTGKRKKVLLHNAVIESKRRATYEEIQTEYEAKKDVKDWEYQSHFELYHLLKQTRLKRGSIDFELPETVISVDDQCEPTGAIEAKRFDSHRLIEEFMIAANEGVTDWALKRNIDFVYRVHETPDPLAIENFLHLADTTGVKAKLSSPPDPKEIAKFLDSVVNHPSRHLLNSALLRSMKQAKYEPELEIHFGLASAGYTHFTSPIRRYPDLVVHRLLKDALSKEKKNKPLKTKDNAQELIEICQHCNYRERLAVDAERQIKRIKQVRLLRERLGDEFDAKIIGMNKNGVFVQLFEPFVEAFVPKDFMGNDQFNFFEKELSFVGKRSKMRFKIGDLLSVRCEKASLERREIDCAVIETKKPKLKN